MIHNMVIAASTRKTHELVKSHYGQKSVRAIVACDGGM